MGSKKTSTTNAKVGPINWAKDSYKLLEDDLQSAYLQGKANKNYYDGDFVARPDAALTDQISQAYQGSAAQSRDASSQVLDLRNNLTDATFGGPGDLDPTRWQGDDGGVRLDSALNAAIQPVLRQLTDQILPGIKSSAIESGAYSGDRAMQVLPTEAIAETGARASEITQQLAYEGFQQEQQRDLAAATAYEDALARAFALSTERGLGLSADKRANVGLGADLLNQSMLFSASEGDLLSAARDALLMEETANVQNDLARDAYDIAYPYEGIDIAASLLDQIAGKWSKQKQQTTEKTGGLGSVVQGAAGLVSGLGALGVFGPAGALAGTAAGGAGAAAPAAAAQTFRYA